MTRLTNTHQEGAGGLTGADKRSRWVDSWSKAQVLYPSDQHGMPQPTWAVRGFTDDGATAWNRLSQIAPERQGAMSIYVHIPFCKTRCPFCDCHATVMPQKSRDIVEHYIRRLVQEVRQWRTLGCLSQRPVTTVHFGGGTPNSIEPQEIENVVLALRTSFAAHKQTEWAIETNCRCLDEEHIARLDQLGFTRIHVGVQTLRRRLRSMLGRRDTPETAIARISACLRRGWVVSVDMVYGLPEQTTADLLADIQLLAAAGVHGVSLYRLNHGNRNHGFMLRHNLANRGMDRLSSDYLMFMEAADLLTSRGYAKNHFTHFALAADRNLYSRHAVRGEDLLALGATADGVFGDYYYRHGDLTHYLAGGDERPSFQRGGFFTQAERRARGLVTQLMSGHVFENELDEQAGRFVRKLVDADLLVGELHTRSWKLTDAGSWFIERCTADARRIYESPFDIDAVSHATKEDARGNGAR